MTDLQLSAHEDQVTPKLVCSEDILTLPLYAGTRTLTLSGITKVWIFFSPFGPKAPLVTFHHDRVVNT